MKEKKQFGVVIKNLQGVVKKICESDVISWTIEITNSSQVVVDNTMNQYYKINCIVHGVANYAQDHKTNWDHYISANWWKVVLIAGVVSIILISS